MAPCRAAVVKTRATCALLLLLLLLADVRPRSVAGQAPPEPEAVATIEADADGRGNGTRGAGGGGNAARKVLSTIDCQICEATCRVKCLINNLFQWGTCYQRCKADNCNDWCR
ncbi:uncharacterized protein LOC119312958 [Triticum dicoccoides]|uniref:Uncharacterized protein n=1 Tax=Triticum turgidum subsp. durum TaxID=4567 RepID=A0A9R0R723_TRITD|nr:uncharacterized protein LOC119312958 [Triticum dicoccoides]VAH23477.1 unnamed protein product [Triticum turgidum subsp. durum]